MTPFYSFYLVLIGYSAIMTTTIFHIGRKVKILLSTVPQLERFGITGT